MKISKAGIAMYEDDDELDGENITENIGDAANRLRKEINKIALVIDAMQEQIDSINRRITNNRNDRS